ncbi:MAG: hypothetical protein NT129_06200, partial [Candidatus Aenigmarchaeota archaeon]|nr:hypothetical protein [Candidatus Aenigmarchaeota archaeon]
TEDITLRPFEKEIGEIKKDIAKEIVLKAIPIKGEAGLPEKTSDCSLLSKDLIASEAEDTNIIVLCLEGVEQ